MHENNDINLRDYIWETEEHRFEPKPNTHSNTKKMKQREAEKKLNSGNRKNRMEPAIVYRKQAADKKLLDLELKEHIDELNEQE